MSITIYDVNGEFVSASLVTEKLIEYISDDIASDMERSQFEYVFDPSFPVEVYLQCLHSFQDAGWKVFTTYDKDTCVRTMHLVDQ